MGVEQQHPALAGRTGALSPRRRLAVLHLLEAQDAARDAGRNVHDFAVPLQEFRAAGVYSADIRWLICMRYVSQAVPGPAGSRGARTACPPDSLAITDASCFILTAAGADLGHALAVHAEDGASGPAPAHDGNGDAAAQDRPCWDDDLLELRFNGLLVKKFRQPSPDQEIILASFEELGWARRIDDPLPPRYGQTNQQRLHSAIRRLNNHQQHELLSFRSDGRGQGICWVPRADSRPRATPERHECGA